MGKKTNKIIGFMTISIHTSLKILQYISKNSLLNVDISLAALSVHISSTATVMGWLLRISFGKLNDLDTNDI